MDAAIAAAQHAFLSWSRASGVTDRAMLIGRVAKMHTERRIALATAMNEEMGKPIHEALAEVDFSASIYAYYAENAETFLADEPINLREGEGSALIRRQPVGVLLGIMPWNYPVYQVARFAGPNSRSATPSSSSTRPNARSRQRCCRRSSSKPDTPKAPTPTST